MRKQKIKLMPDERQALLVHYLTTKIPIDQFAQRPADFLRFVRIWNGRIGKDHSQEDVRHYMLTERKGGRWPTFDGVHKRLKCPPDDYLTETEWAVLIQVHGELGHGRDVYAVDGSASHALELRFLQRSGRHVAANMLYAALMMLEKSGRLSKPDRDIGFGDIDAIG